MFEDIKIEDLYFFSTAGGNCLLNEESVFDTTDWNSYIDELTGQKYDVNDQCHQVYNDQSFYCGVS